MKPNPGFVERALALYDTATARVERARKEMEEAGRDRSLALALLHDHGLSYSEIAKLVSISSPRVGQMITSLREES